MQRSLRRTLAVRSAATVAVGLAVAAAVAHWSASRVLVRQLDQALGGAAFIAAEHFRSDSGPLIEPLITVDRSRYAREVNRYIVLRDADGRVVRALPQYAADLPLDTAAMRAAENGQRVWVSARWGREPVRSVYVTMERAGVGGNQVLQVAASLRPLLAVRRDFVLALAGVVLVGTGVTLLGAWRLGGSVVRPVGEITAQATRIEAGTLDQRIAAHAETEEYRELVAVLNRMLERLDRAFQAQTRLTADVSHELRSPLTALQGEIEVALRAERTPREYQRVLRSALEEIGRLTAMSEDLLLVARAEAHLIRLQREPSDVNGLVRRALDGVRGRLAEKELMLQEAPGAANGLVPLDPVLMTQLLDHLLDNAVKFTPVGGRVVIGTAPIDGGVRVFVEDSGPGIAAEDLPHVFEPFYRADQARSRGTGTGLGLALAAAIARLHGGTIRAANVDGGGARFEVDLPMSNGN